MKPIKNLLYRNIYPTDHVLQKYSERVFNVNSSCSLAYVKIHRDRLIKEVKNRIQKSEIKTRDDRIVTLQHNKLVFIINKKRKTILTCYLTN